MYFKSNKITLKTNYNNFLFIDFIKYKGLKIKLVHNKKDQDKRDYFVSNKKIEKAGFKPKISFFDGVFLDFLCIYILEVCGSDYMKIHHNRPAIQF